MTAPGNEISSDELWLRLTQIQRPSKLVDYPKADPVTGESMGKVLIQVLTQQEQQEAAIAAARYTKEQLKDSSADGIGYENVYKNAASTEVLWRAVRQEANPMRPFFPSPKLMRDRLTVDEVGVLTAMYIEVQAELGPIVSRMGPNEMEAWVMRLSEGGSSFPLASLSWEARSELIMLMASRLYPYLTDSTSHGSQPEDPSSETPNDSE